MPISIERLPRGKEETSSNAAALTFLLALPVAAIYVFACCPLRGTSYSPAEFLTKEL
jgi:hypothetical protein